MATRLTFLGPPQPDRPTKAKGSISSSAADHLAARPWTGILGISAARARGSRMTIDKDFKRIVRAKARLSGQSYTVV